jgi:hypothetical protein
VLTGGGIMYCSNCGAAQPDRTRFCTRCGTQLADAGRDKQSPRQNPAYGAPGRYPPPGGPAYDQPPQPIAPPYPGPPRADPRYARQAQPAAPANVPSPRRRRSRGAIAAALAVVVVLGGLAVAGWREHWPPAVFGKAAPLALTWSAAQAPLPADAAQTSSQNAGLFDVACPSVQNCLAVGNYTTSDSDGNNGSTQGLAETLSDGTWTPTAARIDVPDASQVTNMSLDGVACPAAGACVAVGSYDSQGNLEPLIETLSGGTWASAIPPLPGDTNQKSAYLGDVACPAQGTCVATGWYADQNGDIQGLIDTLSGGTWTPEQAPLPAGAVPGKSSSSSLPTALFVVKCPAVGNCVAAGDYTSQNGGHQGLIDTLSGGTWTAMRAPLPADAVAANPVAYLLTIACPAPGTCLAAGRYTGQDGRGRFLTETLSGGAWTPAAAPLPADAAANQKWSESQVTGFTAAACAAAGTCVAAGSYFLTNGTIQGVIDTLSGGTWTATKAPLPAGAAVAKQYIYFDSAVCPATGRCLAVGGYKVQNGSYQALIETAAARAGPG